MTEYPNWFEYVRPNFEQFLTPLAGKSGLKFLQLGVYTGDASLWLVKNILTAQSSYLDDVDTWQGSDEEQHKVMDFENVYNTYLHKISDYEQNHINIKRQDTTSYLMDHRTQSKEYDFIYIDADHTTVGVILDAELSWPLLKSGGIMAFDDYTWGHDSGDPRLAPQVGIDLFLHRHQLDIEILTKNSQVWIKKR
jgi:hypothetical protein